MNMSKTKAQILSEVHRLTYVNRALTEIRTKHEERIKAQARRLAAMERVVEAVKRWQKVPPDLYAIKAAVDEIDTALAALDAKEVG